MTKDEHGRGNALTWYTWCAGEDYAVITEEELNPSPGPKDRLLRPLLGIPDQTVSLFVCVLNQPSKHADLIVFKRGKEYINAGVEPAAGQEEREEAVEAEVVAAEVK